MPAAHGQTLFAGLTMVVLLCYGGGFGTMPAFAADYFGAEHVGSIYGLMLTAWGVAGVLGPTLMAALRERSGGYDQGLRLIAGLMLVSAIIPLLVRFSRGPLTVSRVDGANGIRQRNGATEKDASAAGRRQDRSYSGSRNDKKAGTQTNALS